MLVLDISQTLICIVMPYGTLPNAPVLNYGLGPGFVCWWKNRCDSHSIVKQTLFAFEGHGFLSKWNLYC